MKISKYSSFLSLIAEVLAVVALTAMAPAAMAICNTSPVANDESVKVINQPTLIDVLVNDRDAEGQALTITVSSTTCIGSATVDFDLLIFTPSITVSKTCEIDYTITDEGGLSDTATATIKVVEGIFSDAFESGDTSRWFGS